MTQAPDHLSNILPDGVAAVMIHRVHKALTAEQVARNARRLAEKQAERAGVPLGGLRRARRILTADPDRLEQQAREEAVILKATRSGVQIEQPSLFDSTTDQSDEARDRRLYDEGWSAAVWCVDRAACPYTDGDDVNAWLSGFDGFLAHLAAYESTEQKMRRAK